MVEAKNMCMRYNKCGDNALEDISFFIDRGEFVFFVGSSGAGKSTLLKLVIRELRPTEGELKVFGRDVGRLPRHRLPYLRRNIGMVFQDFRLIEERTAYDNVAFAMMVTGATRSEIRKRVPHVLGLVGLQDKAGARICDLSGGEQQRAGLARAIANRPAMIIADEPTGNLDPGTTLDIMNLLRSINLRGTTVLVATHNRDIVDRFKKRVLYLENGRLVGDEQKGIYTHVH
ncbi:MAG: cell division ATP-binding protein FtsE [Dethiobacteria bacterium]|nr:cell division ATP-binding protein FtsE [Bacillota bacterium]MDW7729239.1 cell division ATP-binding protein FtsE [Bacillota bacterium]